MAGPKCCALYTPVVGETWIGRIDAVDADKGTADLTITAPPSAAGKMLRRVPMGDGPKCWRPGVEP